MTKRSISLTALILAFLCLSSLFLSACEKCEQNPGSVSETSDSEIAISFGNTAITVGEFRFYLAKYKTVFSKTYKNFSNTHEFFTSVSASGETMEKKLFREVIENVARTAICEELFNNAGMELDTETVESVDDYISSLLYWNYEGEEENLSKALKKYGINPDILKTVYLRDEKAYDLRNSLTSKGQELYPSDSDKYDYLNTHYARILHIYVNDKYKYATDSDGNPIYGSDGNQSRVALSDEELRTKKELIDAIETSLGSGGNFTEIYEAFSEDRLYDNGYYLTSDMEFIDEVVDLAFSLYVGQWGKCESSQGTHFVVRMPMQTAPWSDKANRDFFENFDDKVAEKKFVEYIESFLDDVVVDYEKLTGITIENSLMAESAF